LRLSEKLQAKFSALGVPDLTPVCQVCKLMEETVKVRLLLISALVMLVQIPTSRAQVRVDMAKITCRQLLVDEIAPSEYVAMWLSGYYNGKRNNTIIESETMIKNAKKVSEYCYRNREATVTDAVKNVLGFEN
jgi:acid stress chaperone HdeB